MNPGIEAVRKLVGMGYWPQVEGDNIRLRHEAPDSHNPKQVAPLLEAVQQHKDEVLFFLRCFCPRCGGACFGTIAGVEQCMACYFKGPNTSAPQGGEAHAHRGSNQQSGRPDQLWGITGADHEGPKRKGVKINEQALHIPQ